MNVREIAVVRALQLGDMMCAVPALRSLRAGCPEARITLIGLPWAQSFVERFPELDAFLEFPGWYGIPERSFDGQRFEAFKHALPAAGFDLAVQLHGDGSVMNDFVSILPSYTTAAFVSHLDAGLPNPLDGGCLVPYPEELPEPRRLLKLPAALGMPAIGEHLEFPVHEDERAEAAQLRAAAGLPDHGYVCIHPGSNSGGRWPIERFAEVARRLIAAGHRIAVTGTADERPLARTIVEGTHGEAVDLTGRTTLGVLGALLENAGLQVANDTGVAHVGAALGVPSVIIFTTADVRRWAPLDRSRHVVLGGDGSSPTAGDVIAAASAHLRRAA